MTNTLLLELLTEELPPKNLIKLSQSFADNIFNGLKARNFLNNNAIIESYATPRRLALTITNVQAMSQNKSIRIKILPIHLAFDMQGNPTETLIKKLKTLSIHLKIAINTIKLNELEKSFDDNIESLFYTHIINKDTLQNGLQITLEETINKLPIATLMNYERQDYSYKTHYTIHHFIRPVHRLLALYNNIVIPLQILGLQADQITEGHRFLSQGIIKINNAQDYIQSLNNIGKVIPSFNIRKDKIRRALLSEAGTDKVLIPTKLLNEITALVEWPVIYTCQFDPQFLTIPQECLILTMQVKQKCFALTNADGKLNSRFLIVSNIETSNPQHIIKGNECVIQARLSDAKFFFEQDKKKALIEHLPFLAKVIYHSKLGSQLDRTNRIKTLASNIAILLGENTTKINLIERSALLAKTDLLTNIVAEFPELQGIMGGHYARHDGELEEIAIAISEHYQPRFAGDILPTSNAGITIALADKLETLVGIWSIGQRPINNKDPFALRRHALGILRILIEKRLPLSIKILIEKTTALFTTKHACKDCGTDICIFLYNRLHGLLHEYGYAKNHIESIMTKQPEMLHNILDRLKAIKKFVISPEASTLIAANKRVDHILKKFAIQEKGVIKNNLLHIDSEKTLYFMMQTLKPQIDLNCNQGNFDQALKLLIQLQYHIDSFFKNVMVNVQEKEIFDNRKNLLYELKDILHQVADFSKLAI